MLVSGKGQGKVHAILEPLMPMVETLTPPSLEFLLVDLTLFKKPLLKDLEEVITKMVTVYGNVVIKKVQDLLRDYNPF